MMTTEATPGALGSNGQLGLAPEWAMHIAAQCWCEPTTSMIEMDSRLALVFAAKLAAERERCAQIVEYYNPGGSYHIRTALAFAIRRA